MMLAAQSYAAKRVAVFPVDGKIPLPGSRGVLDATTDLDVIRERFAERHNVAIATGRSGLVVFDLDQKNGVDGERTLAELCKTIGELPPTRTARTPSGGLHLYFACRDPELRPSAGKVGNLDAPGVDIRAGNSYVVAPPSVIDGAFYRWEVECKPAPLPRAWVKALKPTPREPVKWEGPPASSKRVEKFCASALEREARALAAVPPGQRSHELWRAAAALGGLVHLGAFGRREVEKALRWAVSRWRPADRTPRKTENTLQRGLAFGLDHPRDFGGHDAAA